MALLCITIEAVLGAAIIASKTEITSSSTNLKKNKLQIIYRREGRYQTSSPIREARE
jgi:hypothetical protein